LKDNKLPMKQRIRFCTSHERVRLQTSDDVDDKKIQMLVAAAENCCVVLQTLRNGVAVQTQVEAGTAVAASAAAAA